MQTLVPNKPATAALSFLAGVVLTIGVLAGTANPNPELKPGCVQGYAGTVLNGVPVMVPAVICPAAPPPPQKKREKYRET